MKEWNKYLFVVIFMFFSFMYCVSAETIDTTNKGEVNVLLTIEDNYERAGHKITMYYVSKLIDTINMEYSLTDEFFSLEKIDINTIVDYIETHNIQGDEQYTGEDANVIFSNLEFGQYVVVIDDVVVNSELTYGFEPFLVNIPLYDDGWNYRIMAEPKRIVSGANEGFPEERKIPETGTLMYLVPILLGTGIILIVLGSLIGYEKKDI